MEAQKAIEALATVRPQANVVMNPDDPKPMSARHSVYAADAAGAAHYDPQIKSGDSERFRENIRRLFVVTKRLLMVLGITGESTNKHKRSLSVHQKQMRFLTVLITTLAIVLFSMIYWIMLNL